MSVQRDIQREIQTVPEDVRHTYTNTLLAAFAISNIDRKAWDAFEFESRVLVPALHPELFPPDEVIPIDSTYRIVSIHRFREQLSYAMACLVETGVTPRETMHDIHAVLGWASMRTNLPQPPDCIHIDFPTERAGDPAAAPELGNDAAVYYAFG